jgi:hypothetical protein
VLDPQREASQMTRMLDDDFPGFVEKPKRAREPDEVRKRVFTEQMARLKVPVKADKPVEMDAATRAHLEARDQAQGFIRISERLTISPALAKMLGYRAEPSRTFPNLPASSIDGDAEAQSLDEARR